MVICSFDALQSPRACAPYGQRSSCICLVMPTYTPPAPLAWMHGETHHSLRGWNGASVLCGRRFQNLKLRGWLERRRRGPCDTSCGAGTSQRHAAELEPRYVRMRRTSRIGKEEREAVCPTGSDGGSCAEASCLGCSTPFESCSWSTGSRRACVRRSNKGSTLTLQSLRNRLPH